MMGKVDGMGRNVNSNPDISSGFMKYPPFGLRRVSRSGLAQDYTFGASNG
jgi:hypothetical protein